jgi:hypothetical protein
MGRREGERLMEYYIHEAKVDEKGNIKLSRFDLENLKRFAGLTISLLVKKYSKKRSLAQNSYYWAVLVPMIKDASGYETKDATHAALKAQFLKEKRFLVNDDGLVIEIDVPRSTTTLTVAEFVEFVNSVEMLAVDFFGLRLPYAEDKYTLYKED